MNLQYLVKKPLFSFNRQQAVESMQSTGEEPMRFKNAIAAFFDRHLHEPEDLIQELPETQPRVAIDDPLSFLPGQSKSPRTNLVSALRALKCDLDLVDKSSQPYSDHVTVAEINRHGTALNAYLHAYHCDLVIQLRRGVIDPTQFDGDFMSVVETLGFVIWVDKDAVPDEQVTQRVFHLFYNNHRFDITYYHVKERQPFARRDGSISVGGQLCNINPSIRITPMN